MKRFLIFLISLTVYLSIVLPVHAQLNNVGLGPFALTKSDFNCRSFFKELRPLKELHISVLFNTFGNDNRCLVRLLDDPRLKTIQIHLINEPCHRNNQCGKYEFLASVSSPAQYSKLWGNNDPSLIRKFVTYVKPVQDILETNLKENTQCLINPGLESNLNDAAAKNLIKKTRELFPACRIVWNPLAASSSTSSSLRNGSDLLEGHGSTPNIFGPCIANLDGTDIDFPSRPTPNRKIKDNKNYVQSGNPLQQYIETYANRCEVVFLWTQEMNCRNDGSGGFIDPRARSCKNAVNPATRLMVKEIVHANRRGVIDQGNIPWSAEEDSSLNSCTSVNEKFNDKLKAGNLLKQSEFRERGGVIIFAKGNYSSVKIISKGREVDNYISSGLYEHDSSDRPLWRSTKTPLKYPLRVVIQATIGKQKFCWKVNNPRVRVD